MRVKFIGNPIDPSDNRGFIVWAGERFDLNIARDLPEGPVFAKIPTNAHFQVVEDDAIPSFDTLLSVLDKAREVRA
jgi:hypothetical protein